MSKSVLLLSGGLDSTVNAAMAARETRPLLAITCDYGQRAAAKEISSSRAICARYSIPHRAVELQWLSELAATPLTRRDMPLPDPAYAGFASSDAQVWLPNRNGVLVNVAAAYAEALGADSVITGFNAEEAAGFPDNSQQFLDALNVCFSYSVRGKVRVFSYTSSLDKAQIISLARQMNVPLELSWWCYDAGEQPCWRCGSCARFRMAAEKAGCLDWLASRGVVPLRGTREERTI